MSAATTTGTLTAEASQAISQRLGEGDALAGLRAAAWAEASVRAMPTTMERPWKYLDVSRIDLGAYRPAAARVSIEAPAGVTAVAFADAEPQHRSLVEQKLGSAVTFSRSKLTALHYAFAAEGVLIHVDPNAGSTAAVRLTRTVDEPGVLWAPHTLIVSGAHSRVNVIEDYRSAEGADIVALPAVEILPGPGAEVRYTALHRWGAATRVFGDQRTVTDRDSAVVSLSLVAGGAIVKSHIESSLVGRGSSSELFGLGVTSGAQHADFYTIQDHIGPDTRSDLLFKSALKDRSRAVYYGVTRVGLGARNADANQESRNLILSREAKADSDPVLEILTNDVIRVSHGATAGPVDREQLYYLQTRGIARAQAEALLVRAFLGQVLDRVPDEALRSELEEALESRMGA